MKQEYEIVHRFKSESKKERSDNLYRRLLEYKDHLRALDSKNEEGIHDVDGSSVH